MRRCTICHTGIYTYGNGILKDNKVYLLGDDDNLYLPEEMLMAREECEGGFIQFEVEGKWGFADIFTGEVIVEPVWDYAGPFYRGHAHVVLGGTKKEIHKGCYASIEDGKHGYIDTRGNIAIPLEYDSVEEGPYRQYFRVSKNRKWGIVDNKNEIIIPLQWDRLKTSYDHDLIFCARKEIYELSEPTHGYPLKWGVYDKDFNLIVEPELDQEPIALMIKDSPKSTSYTFYKKYFALKIQRKYGVLCNDGRLIANIELSKKQVVEMINNVSERRVTGDLYL